MYYNANKYLFCFRRYFTIQCVLISMLTDFSSLAEWSACLATNQVIGGKIPGTSTFKKWIRSGNGFTRLHEDNWIATRLRISGSD